jgi:glucose-6-phosphate 1-dehydrogenase
VSEINVIFRSPPLMYFGARNGGTHWRATVQPVTTSQAVRNAITLRIQPDESIILSFDAKLPGRPD